MSDGPRTADRTSRARGLLWLVALLTLLAFGLSLAACGDDADDPGTPVASLTPASPR